MKETIIKGTGNSRSLKSVSNFLTVYPTYEAFAQALITGTLPVDIGGPNAAGVQQAGDPLNKATLLKDATAAMYGLPATAVPDDVLMALAHGGSFPVGSILWCAIEAAPNGFLICDGSAISRSIYSRLFSAIGTQFGAGDNSTTFNIPDLRASFIRGAGSKNGFSASFAGVQNPTYIQGARHKSNKTFSLTSKIPANIDRTNLSSTSATIEILRAGGESPSYFDIAEYGVRPYNIALTPIIKY